MYLELENQVDELQVKNVDTSPPCFSSTLEESE
jgi:hypothetical protein